MPDAVAARPGNALIALFTKIEDCGNTELLVSDSAALEDFMFALDGYTICSGIHPEQFSRSRVISMPLDEPEYMEIGYLLKKGQSLSDMGEIFINSLKEFDPNR